MIRQHNAIAQANLPLPEVPGLAEHQAAEAEVNKFIRSTGPTFKPLEHILQFKAKLDITPPPPGPIELTTNLLFKIDRETKL